MEFDLLLGYVIFPIAVIFLTIKRCIARRDLTKSAFSAK